MHTDTSHRPPHDVVIGYLLERRRNALRAIRACPDASANYWRWQGHAELSRQLLELYGEKVPS
jgi:hypothetical protein